MNPSKATPKPVTNPFVRKRAVGSDGTDKNVLGKRPRLGEEGAFCSSGTQGAPASTVRGRSDGMKGQSSLPDTNTRSLEKAKFRPLGGYAASDAVKSVLTQRGAP